jgi:hypothetical protein
MAIERLFSFETLDKLVDKINRNFSDADKKKADKTDAWTSWTPTITSGSGTFTSVSSQGYWIQIGKVVHFSLIITITTNGTAATNVKCPLPTEAKRIGTPIYGRETATTGKSLNGQIDLSTSVFQILNYDNSYPGGNGYTLNVAGTYEVA